MITFFFFVNFVDCEAKHLSDQPHFGLACLFCFGPDEIYLDLVYILRFTYSFEFCFARLTVLSPY